VKLFRQGLAAPLLSTKTARLTRFTAPDGQFIVLGLIFLKTAVF
jgi:hypothetical protein